MRPAFAIGTASVVVALAILWCVWTRSPDEPLPSELGAPGGAPGRGALSTPGPSQGRGAGGHDAIARHGTGDPAAGVAAAVPPPPPKRYRGRLIDELGEPVARAYVGLFTMPGWKRQQVFRSNDAGHVVFEVPPGLEGTPWISASCPTYQNQAHAFPDFLARQKNPRSFVFLVPHGYLLCGHVFDEDGLALEKVTVRLDLDSVPPTTTAVGGGFSFQAGIPPGKRVLHFAAKGFIPHRMGVEIPVAEGPYEVVLFRQRFIRGVVTDEVGARLPGICIASQDEAGTSCATTDEHGFFELAERYRGSDEVHLSVAPGTTEPWTSEHPVPWGATDVTIALRRPLSFDLWVFDAETRAPVEAFSVVLLEPGSSHPRKRYQGEFEDGHLRIIRVLRGTWRIRVIPADSAYEPSPLREIVIDDGVALKERIGLVRRGKRGGQGG